MERILARRPQIYTMIRAMLLAHGCAALHAGRTSVVTSHAARGARVALRGAPKDVPVWAEVDPLRGGDLPVWAEVDDGEVEPAEEKNFWDIFQPSDGSGAAAALKREARSIQQIVDEAATRCSREIRMLEAQRRKCARETEKAERRAEDARASVARLREEARDARGPAPKEAVAAAVAAAVAGAEAEEDEFNKRAAAARARAEEVVASRAREVEEAAAANAADVASAEADRDKALAEQRVAEERRTFAISEAAASVDASIQRVEASLERAARDRRARPAPEPAAQALAGGLCGLLLCDALHLDGIDLFGFLAGVGLMVAKLPSTSEKATS